MLFVLELGAILELDIEGLSKGISQGKEFKLEWLSCGYFRLKCRKV